MTIRSKLSILFTLLSAAVLFIFAGVLYIHSKKSREKEFYDLLEKEALTKANLFFNAKVDATTLQDIYRSNREILNEVEVAIYDVHSSLLYHDAVDIDFVKETPEMLASIFKNGIIRFYQDDWQVVGIVFQVGGEKYGITAAAFDGYGFNKLSNQLRSSVWVFFLSILGIYFLGRYFSAKALSPVKEMIGNVNRISASNLGLRLYESTEKDELSHLANTFNEMLDRLETSFESQKNFVSSISHELRTPLAAMIAELDLAMEKQRSTAEYLRIISLVRSDAAKLVKLSNTLFDFAKASYDPAEISFKNIRLDEVLLDASIEVRRLNAAYNVHLRIDEDYEDDQDVSLVGNEYLLKVAFINLMENSCKFSPDKSVEVSLGFDEREICIRFKDAGVGISEADVARIFDPFFRGENQFVVEGNGIGLSLTKKIVQLHQGTIDVVSQKGTGSVFTLTFPHRD
ncbi:MAG: HAMP domain-containing histidine kinase [Lunatimonas sp.]|uniref:HAMP domain-containing sensor histidine kinase n=1 Tax=Lunatimonas sp. TaxID=2060141 RepID=UPI00263BA54F|nr:HAMP domain-containing sensor histidine kinase [Lunatimonas sp.]MCC5938762.1 HAMP domain-containing histidine kinase [Lunatimonas sp.]